MKTYLLEEHKVFLIFTVIFCVSLVHFGNSTKTDKMEILDNESELREKRSEIPVLKFGLKIAKWMPPWWRARRANKILQTDATLYLTKHTGKGTKLQKYQKKGGCSRAREDFDLCDVADITTLGFTYSEMGPVGDFSPASERKLPVTGKVGNGVIEFSKSNPCRITLFRPSTGGSSDKIVVDYI